MSIVDWVKAHIGPPQPAGPAARLASFSIADQPIARDSLSVVNGAWRIETGGKRTFRLFEIPAPDVERCMLTYRATIRCEQVRERAYLELWCRFAGLGEFFSKGVHQPVRGSSSWASYETSFLLQPGQRPDMIKLNVTFDGPGTLWIKDIELLATPLR